MAKISKGEQQTLTISLTLLVWLSVSALAAVDIGIMNADAGGKRSTDCSAYNDSFVACKPYYNGNGNNNGNDNDNNDNNDNDNDNDNNDNNDNDSDSDSSDSDNGPDSDPPSPECCARILDLGLRLANSSLPACERVRVCRCVKLAQRAAARAPPSGPSLPERCAFHLSIPPVNASTNCSIFSY